MIGIISAMAVESDALRQRMTDVTETCVSGQRFFNGRIDGVDVVLAVCGIGKVNAAVCAQTMILRFSPECVINSGVGGALDSTLRTLDIVCGTAAVQHDCDTSPLGDPIGLVSTVNLVQFPLDEALRNELSAAIAANGIEPKSGIIATGDQFINSRERKQFIKDTFHASVCEMEGGAIAHACHLNGVPCAILRAISDGADDDAHLSYDAFVKLAAANSIEALLTFIKKRAK